MARRRTPSPDEAVVAAATTIVQADAAARARAADAPPRPKTSQARRSEGFLELQMHRAKSEVAYRDVLTAAAMVMDPDNPPEGGWPAPNTVTRTWQHTAWGYTRSVPELSAAKMFIGNCLSRCKLVVGKRNPDGSVEQGFDGNEPVEGIDGAIAQEAATHINTLQTPRGGQSEILRSFGERIFVAGECYIVPEDLPTGLVFEVLSTQELIPEGKEWRKFYGPGWGEAPLPPGSKPIRVWRQDGQYQMLASSSVRACLEVLEELVVLTRLVRAAAISRMSLAGILLIPDELDTPDDGTDADGGQSEAQNPLITDIVNTGAKAIDDPASAAAWLPYILQGPQEYLKEVRHVAFQTDDQEHVIKRAEAVERLARGLDLPPEKVLGHMGTTFANAAQISEDNFNLYIEPALQMICDALTVAYLWPAMAKDRGIEPEHLAENPWPEEITQVCITYDARRLISKPDRSKEIIDVYLHDLTFMAITIGEVREAVGLDSSKPPDDLEVAKRIDAYRLGRIREVIQAPPSDAAVPIADATAGKAPIPGQSEGSKLAGATPKGASEVVKEQELLASGVLDPLRHLAVQIASAAELTVDRALERMGARIVSKGAKTMSDEERSSIYGVPNAAIARTLGTTVVARILGPRDDPTLAEVGAFTRKVTAWARQAECEDAAHVASEATAVVTTLIHRAIWDEPLPITADLFGAALLGVPVSA